MVWDIEHSFPLCLLFDGCTVSFNPPPYLQQGRMAGTGSSQRPQQDSYTVEEGKKGKATPLGEQEPVAQNKGSQMVQQHKAGHQAMLFASLSTCQWRRQHVSHVPGSRNSVQRNEW